jgi:hypothetical protein
MILVQKGRLRRRAALRDFAYAEPVRMPRRLERFILGSMMSLVALLAERRVIKALGKKR